MKFICPSILSADFSRLGEEIRIVEDAGADIIHCDIMDGSFVPNISFGAKVIRDVRKITSLPLDVHLMINNADMHIPEFIKAGANFISVHYENNTHLHRTISTIKDAGIKAGVVINPATPVFILEDIISTVDFVLVMSVNPGFGGQKFIEHSYNKIKELKDMIIQLNEDCLIEVDGGVSIHNIADLCNAGADMFVAGSSVFNAVDKTQAITKLKEAVSQF
ncbi:MAG: ribulose-phosphate 3-epimerase [Ignavibacteria bacterium]|jgi:ribulose-phosphate 3-epimerase|nr:ribulose-phosphate 3-epimerase [Ignavibacteria bacterium]MBK6878272.1 ribulose-phosphate 3-epimerase [Ignavibacteria bacterium]MBK9227998.1 ribulose-phosphate 3-epimerase [Ignavibacteria bacterium]